MCTRWIQCSPMKGIKIGLVLVLSLLIIYLISHTVCFWETIETTEVKSFTSFLTRRTQNLYI